MTSEKKQLAAYIVPFLAFLGFIGLAEALGAVLPQDGPGWMREPRLIVYPLQTVVCGALLVYYWKHYTFGPLRPWLWGIGVGVLALLIWISPQVVFGAPPRGDGFNPESLGTDGHLYLLTIVARMARLIIVVPLLEEIFWRGFLMRFLVKDNFTSVPFGTYSPLAFYGVAALFMLEHHWADWPAAFLTGILYNFVAVKTKSLFACVVAHAVTNALLGVYILQTKQWGFW